ncbi:MAG: hypothetical protein HYU66_19970 [Armatimonadetes bacterium]|nr:hypothetical protein [Armatimonadota bacterium]
MAGDSQSPSRVDELKALTFGFDEHPLEHFRGMTDAEIQAHPGIGPKYRQRIQAALAELAELTGVPNEPPAAAAAPLEPVAPGTSGPLTLVMVLILAAIVVVGFLVATRGTNPETRQELADLKESDARARQTFRVIATDASRAALGHAVTAYKCASEGNLGLGRLELVDVEVALQAVRNAAQLGGDVALPGRLAAAEAATREADEVLRLRAPQSQDQVVVAVDAMVQAINALQPQEVKQ